jgi:hypothetical protein
LIHGYYDIERFEREISRKLKLDPKELHRYVRIEWNDKEEDENERIVNNLREFL